MTNDQIVDKLNQLADLLEFKGTNPFRLRAYRTAAKAITEMTESVKSLVEEEFDLTTIAGIGKAVAEKCEQLVKTGSMRQLDELLKEIPVTVLDLMRVPSLGPKKAAVIFSKLGIATLENLKIACEAGKVHELPGFGMKTEQAILAGIAIADAANRRLSWPDADKIVFRLREHFSTCRSVQRIEFAGSYRRGKETVGDLDIVVDSETGEAVMNRLAEFPGSSGAIVRGPTKMSIRLERDFQVDLRVVPAESFGAALQYFTGSKEHNVILRTMAKQRNRKINEWGVFEVHGEQEIFVAGHDEEDVYHALDLPWIPPELREGREEFNWAQSESGIPKLIETNDIRGDLHMHTTESDGTASIMEMAKAARQNGLEYIAITDHSKRVAMANGLDAKRLRKQWRHIDDMNAAAKDGFTILKGVECDILEDGLLDLPDDVLAEADWVTASIHYGQQQNRSQITQRIIGAIENPHVHSISHPTGRLINRRKPYEVDMQAVFEAARDHRKFLELNASPKRLDLHDLHCAQAKSMGILLVINTDAHHLGSLEDMRFGIMQARRGGLTAVDVANSRTLPEFRKLLANESDGLRGN